MIIISVIVVEMKLLFHKFKKSIRGKKKKTPALPVEQNESVTTQKPRQRCFTLDAVTSGQMWYFDCTSARRLVLIIFVIFIIIIIITPPPPPSLPPRQLVRQQQSPFRDLSPPHPPPHTLPPLPPLTRSLSPSLSLAASFNQQPPPNIFLKFAERKSESTLCPLPPVITPPPPPSSSSSSSSPSSSSFLHHHHHIQPFQGST